uniref:Trace amine-associated receptor 9-like n=1 Tax=Phallusia mammillata TaxID=59560 RepID=A0A6F9DUX3_9ASCI|nr:trace amine-associated receptor 9-like [Phallusia mammillata]
MNVSSTELDQRQLSLRGSAQATVGGIFLLLTFTCSLYHLVFMGAQRLYAIKWPLSYRMQSDFHVNVGLAVVWALAVVSSTVPAWFPDSMVYTYQHTTFLFFFTEKKIQNRDGNHNALVAMLIVFYVIPYVIMSLACVATIIVVHINQKKSNQLRQKTDKREVRMFVTVILMQIGFTLTIVPLIVVPVLFFGKSLTCDTASLPFLVCFYLSMSNSLVNVVVYSFRDKNFTKSARDLLTASRLCKNDKPTKSPAASKATNSTSV